MGEPIREMESKRPPLPTIAVAGRIGDQSERQMPVILAAAGAGLVAIAAIAVLLWYLYGRDTWAQDGRFDIPRRVEQAASLPPAAAAEAYESILAESERHKIDQADVAGALEKARARLADVESVLAEQRRAEAEMARREAEERAAEAALAHRRLQEEQQQRELAAQVQYLAQRYLDAPPETRKVVETLTRLNAQIEAGLTSHEYSTAFRSTLAEFRVYELTPPAEQYSIITDYCRDALGQFQLAAEAWRERPGLVKRASIEALEQRIQTHWAAASVYVRLAQRMLDPATCEETVMMYVRARAAAETNQNTPPPGSTSPSLR